MSKRGGYEEEGRLCAVKPYAGTMRLKTLPMWLKRTEGTGGSFMEVSRRGGRRGGFDAAPGGSQYE